VIFKSYEVDFAGQKEQGKPTAPVETFAKCLLFLSPPLGLSLQ